MPGKTAKVRELQWADGPIKTNKQTNGNTSHGWPKRLTMYIKEREYSGQKYFKMLPLIHGLKQMMIIIIIIFDDSKAPLMMMTTIMIPEEQA